MVLLWLYTMIAQRVLLLQQDSEMGIYEDRYEYDSLNRVENVIRSGSGYGDVNREHYSYAVGAAGGTTTLVSQIDYYKGNTIAQGNLGYEYDGAGNIAVITENGEVKVRYYYDGLNQLGLEQNAWTGKCYHYDYDDGGNIIKKQVYPYGSSASDPSTQTYTYTYGDSEWKDLLTNYNGTAITYDGIGNPQNWAGSKKNLTWENGRQLKSLQNGGTGISYTYDESGLRTSKTVGGVTTRYERDANGKVVYQSDGSVSLYYYYDASGNIATFSYNGTRYAYRKNVQGDVIAITDLYGNVAAKYTYDAWGNVTSVTDGNGNVNSSRLFIGNANPIRYRSYFYDTDTSWYYLNSRYYDPAVGRFINADNEDLPLTRLYSHHNKNYFAYSDNNPVIRLDDGGEFWHIIAGGIVGGIIGGVAKAVSSYMEDGEVDWGGVAVATISGAASGAFAATGIGVAGQVAINAALGMGENVSNSLLKKEEINVGSMLYDGLVSGIAGASGGIGKGTSKQMTNLGKQAAKRTISATRKGISNTMSEAAKAGSYYVKSTASYYAKEYSLKSLTRSTATAGINSYLTSNSFKSMFVQYGIVL